MSGSELKGRPQALQDAEGRTAGTVRLTGEQDALLQANPDDIPMILRSQAIRELQDIANTFREQARAAKGAGDSAERLMEATAADLRRVTAERDAAREKLGAAQAEILNLQATIGRYRMR